MQRYRIWSAHRQTVDNAADLAAFCAAGKNFIETFQNHPIGIFDRKQKIAAAFGAAGKFMRRYIFIIALQNSKTLNEKLYRAKADTSGHLPTDTTYWEETNIADLLDRKADVDGHYSSMTVGLAEGIESNRVIEDADVSCPPITFGTTGGDAEIQTGNNKFKFLFGKSKKWNQLA